MTNKKPVITATEQKRWEELNKIRSLPISIAEKRAMKAKLTNLPVLELKWKKRIKWYLKRISDSFNRRLKHRMRTHVVWQRSLQDIELRGGTSIVNVFLFIKWTVYFNMLLSLIVLCFVILPYLVTKKEVSTPGLESCPANYSRVDSARDLMEGMNQSTLVTSLTQLSDCCVTDYYKGFSHGKNDNFWTGFRGTIRGWDQIDFTFSPMTYGFYSFYDLEPHLGVKYRFRQAYLLVPIGIFLLSLVTMVGQIGIGIKEITMAKEGEFYKFSNLIFAGWDHYTKDAAGASFKKKMLQNEMKIALKAEKLKVKSVSTKQQFRLFLKRVLANILVVSAVCILGAAIWLVVDYSIKQSCVNSGCENQFGRRPRISQHLIRLLPAILITACNLVFPIFLKRIIRKLERYSHEVHTALTLIRCLFVRILAITFAAVRYYGEEYCQKVEGSCRVCRHEKDDLTGELRAKDSCWESLFGVHIYLIIMVDFVSKAFLIFVFGYGKLLLGKLTKIESLLSVTKFNIIRHSLDIIYIQCLSWFFYFAPFLPFFVTIYVILVGYMKKFNLMVLSQAVPDTFRTTRTTTVYIITKLLAFVFATLTIGFVLTSVEPSRSCGPFRGLGVPWDVVSQGQSAWVARITAILISPGVAIPVLVVMATLSYYYYNSSLSHRRMVDTLRHMLILEGHDKQYLFERLGALRHEAEAILESEHERTQHSKELPRES